MAEIETIVKNAIKAKLDTLVPTILKEVQEDDFKISDIFDRDIGAYPAAILISPNIDRSEVVTNRDNIIEFTYEIAVLMKADDVVSATQVEELRGTIFRTFDNDPTLGGAADAGVEPSISPTIRVDRAKSFIVFSLILKVKSFYTRP